MVLAASSLFSVTQGRTAGEVPGCGRMEDCGAVWNCMETCEGTEAGSGCFSEGGTELDWLLLLEIWFESRWEEFFEIQNIHALDHPY